MNFLEYLIETHHDYSQSQDFQPLKHGDTMTVFHGFYRIDAALKIAKDGLSGREKADRVYSYEFRNNPYGLFITPELNIAKKFSHGNIKVIMQFVAAYEELEAPVWPNGGYAIQGEYAKTFSGKHERFKAKKAAQYDIESDASMPEWVKLSDDKHLAAMLMTGGESQALFVGHLNPGDIEYFYVSEGNNEYKKLTPSEFLEQYDISKQAASDKLYKPNDNFVGDEFINLLAVALKKNPENTYDIVKGIFERSKKQKNSYRYLSDAFDEFLWSKQMVPLFKWLRNEFR